jgi:hypothetical protein
VGEAVLLTASARRALAVLALGASLAAAQAAAQSVAPAGTAASPSIVELQPAREASRVAVAGIAGVAAVRWVDLNPAVHAWFVLSLDGADGRVRSQWHLENPEPARQRVRLDAADGGALAIERDGAVTRCIPWAGGAASPLSVARAARSAYAPLCDGRLVLRNAVRGHRSALEAGTEFLRDRVPGGEDVVGFVKREVYRDAFVERGTPVPAGRASGGTAAGGAGTPPPLPLRAGFEGQSVLADGLGLDAGPEAAAGWPLGRWRPVVGLPGVHVAVTRPDAVPEPPGTARWRPDPVEAKALVFLVAFDLSRHRLGFSLGTEHPRLGWSARVVPAVRDPASRGPDGIDGAAPLVRTGQVPPAQRADVVATFTGGFKREHGAFRYGALAAANRGSHYGFVEQGVVFSRLVPGLSTLYVLQDGRVGMKTWSEADAALVPRLRDARQNGVPLVETPAGGGAPVIGGLVDRWGPGNWSGSADEQLRSLRAGACLLESGGTIHLVYGWFSTAVPATMARVFLSAGCGHAMHLDMNALEHTYLAVHVRDGARLRIDHLVRGMAQLDRGEGDDRLPRFVGVPDDRDFFTVLRREAVR